MNAYKSQMCDHLERQILELEEAIKMMRQAWTNTPSIEINGKDLDDKVDELRNEMIELLEEMKEVFNTIKPF